MSKTARRSKKLGDMDPNTALQLRLIGMDQKIANLEVQIKGLTDLVNSLATQLKLNAGAIAGLSTRIDQYVKYQDNLAREFSDFKSQQAIKDEKKPWEFWK